MRETLARRAKQIADEALYRGASNHGGGGGGLNQLTGDVLAGPGTGAVPATVARVNGATVPAAGALTVGSVLQVTGTSALGYGPVNLALPAAVTGLLPAANVAPGTNGQVLTTSGGVSTWATPAASGITQLTGDVTAGPGAGSQAATVARVNGATVPAAGALTTGNVLQVTGASTLGYAPVNLALPAAVTGLLPLANVTPSGTNGQVLTTVAGVASWQTPSAGGITQLTGDATAGPGSGSQAAVVVALRGTAISATAPTTGQVLEYNGTAWTPTTPATGGITTLTGDVTAGPGSGSQAATLAAIQGTPIVLGIMHAGQQFYFNGTDWVNGAVPLANLSAPTGTGVALVAAGAWAAAAGTVNLASSTYVSGLLPTANIAPGTSGQVLTTTGGAAVWASPVVNGITQLTGDVTAGPGSGSVASTLAAIDGTPVVIGIMHSGQQFYFNGTDWINGSVPLANLSAPTGTGVAVVNAGIWGAAASIGTANQLFDTNAAGTAVEWFTAGGDLTYAGHSFEVVGILSNVLPAIATGYLNWTGTAWAFTNPLASPVVTGVTTFKGAATSNTFTDTQEGSTTTASPTTLTGHVTINIPSDSVVRLEAEVEAYQTSTGTQGATWKIVMSWINEGGTLTGLKAAVTTFDSDGTNADAPPAGWSVTFTTSAGAGSSFNVAVTVIGQAATTIDWSALCQWRVQT